MINSLFRHIARHKAGYIAIVIAAVLGITVWSYNRVPDFEALKLAGATRNVTTLGLHVLYPNGDSWYRSGTGEYMSIGWEWTGAGIRNLNRVPTKPVDIYLRVAGPNTGLISGGVIRPPRGNALQIARNITSTTYNYLIPPNITGLWKVAVLNSALRAMDESDAAFEIRQPEPANLLFEKIDSSPALSNGRVTLLDFNVTAQNQASSIESLVFSFTTNGNVAPDEIQLNELQTGRVILPSGGGPIDEHNFSAGFGIGWMIPANETGRYVLTGEIAGAPAFSGVRTLLGANDIVVRSERAATTSGLPIEHTLGDMTPGSVVEAGTLSIRQNSSPQSSIMVAGATRQLVAQYEFAAAREAFNVNELTVINDANGLFTIPLDTSAVNRVIIEYPDQSGATQTAALAMTAGIANFSGLTPPMVVPIDSMALLRIYADIQSTDYGQTLSGATFRLGLQDSNVDAPDGTFLAVGTDSSSAIYNPVISGSDNVYKHLVRFTKPTVTKDRGDEVLSDGDKNLYAVRIAADPARRLEIKSVTFRIAAVMGAGDSINNFRIRQDGRDLEASEARIISGDFDLHHITTNFADLDGNGDGQYDGLVKVVFITPQSVAAGTSKTFVLRAAISGANSPSDLISTYVPDDIVFTSSIAASVIASGANFVWSDLSYTSEVHSEVTPDWTNGYLVDTLPSPAAVLAY